MIHSLSSPSSSLVFRGDAESSNLSLIRPWPFWQPILMLKLPKVPGHQSSQQYIKYTLFPSEIPWSFKNQEQRSNICNLLYKDLSSLKTTMDFHWFLNEIQILQDSLKLRDGTYDNVSNLISCSVHCVQHARDTPANLLLTVRTCQTCSCPGPSFFSQEFSCPGSLTV